MKQGMNEIKVTISYLPNMSIKYAGQHKYPPVSKYQVADSVRYS